MGQYTFEDNGDDVIDGTFYYAVHLQGTSPSSFSLLSLPLEAGSLPEHREAIPNLNLTSSLPDDDYTLTIYYTSVVQPDGGGALQSITLDNGGSYYSIDFTLITSPLPVELIDFQAKAHGDAISLDWATEAELDHSHFEIEKSLDGRAWTFMNSVDGRGDNNAGATYHFIDEHVQVGTQFYRLKTVALDGNYEYSAVASATIKEVSNVQLYPNPVKDILTIRQNESEIIRIEIFNSLGQLIQLKSTDSQSLDLNMSDLKQGVYFVNVYRNNQIIKSERLLKRD